VVRLKREPATFTFLDAAQLVKHYFGLKSFCAKEGITEATLIYLYWEPEDAERHSELAYHTRELDEFKQAVSDPAVAFEALSYRELWAAWLELTEPAWLYNHVVALRRRYAINLGKERR
jgi:hypothetical protein